MQIQLPVYPEGTKMVSAQLRVYVKDNMVQYIVNAFPSYSHSVNDLNAFRFKTSNFIHLGLCRKVDVIRVFGVSEDSVGRSYKKYTEKEADDFLGTDARKGKAHKIT